jgi:hypothetical protein
MKTQKFAALAIALTLVLGACAQKTKTTNGEITSSPSAGAGPSAGASPKPRASGTATVGAQPSSTQIGATPKPGSSTTSAPLPTKGSPLAPNALKPIAPGTYTYDESGNRSQGGCGQDGPPPTPTTLQVSPADGNRQQSVRDRGYSSGGLKITTILEYRPEGIFLIYLKQQQNFLGTDIVSEFQPADPPMVAPADPKAGQVWNWSMTSKDGKLTVTNHNTINSTTETTSLGDNSQISTVKSTRNTTIDGKVTVQGADQDVHLKEDATAWGSTAKSLIVRQETHQYGTVTVLGSACNINNNITELLKSTTPA